MKVPCSCHFLKIISSLRSSVTGFQSAQFLALALETKSERVVPGGVARLVVLVVEIWVVGVVGVVAVVV